MEKKPLSASRHTARAQQPRSHTTQIYNQIITFWNINEHEGPDYWSSVFILLFVLQYLILENKNAWMNVVSPSEFFGGKNGGSKRSQMNSKTSKKKPASACPPPENKENDSPDSQKGHHMFFRHEIHLKYMRTITNHDNPTLTHTSNAPNIDRGF